MIVFVCLSSFMHCSLLYVCVCVCCVCLCTNVFEGVFRLCCVCRRVPFLMAMFVV
jgi:hypothetical protein